MKPCSSRNQSSTRTRYATKSGSRSRRRLPRNGSTAPLARPDAVIQNGGELEKASKTHAPRARDASSTQICPGSASQSHSPSGPQKLRARAAALRSSMVHSAYCREQAHSLSTPCSSAARVVPGARAPAAHLHLAHSASPKIAYKRGKPRLLGETSTYD